MDKRTMPGLPMLLILLLLTAGFIYGLVKSILAESVVFTVLSAVTLGVDLFAWSCLSVLIVIGAQVLRIIGEYGRTVPRPGLHYANRFYHQTDVSVPVRNFEAGTPKLSGKAGNPI